MDPLIGQAARALRDAEFVLVGAGAGMSAAAGLDYTDPVSFARLFPGFTAQGFTARYQAIGFDGWLPEQFWGYWATHVMDARFGPRDDAVYRTLRGLLGGKDSFVFTSNVDQFFVRNGFDADRVFTPQGDYGLMQCRRACQPVVWDSEPILADIVTHLHPVMQVLTDPERIPRCPNCGGPVFLNVRLDKYFVETAYLEQSARIQLWLEKARKGRLVVVEIGAGFNTPSVIRWPCERIAYQTAGATLLRINRDHAEVPVEFGDRGISLSMPADHAMAALRNVIG